MIIYNPEQPPLLSDYGIEVPMLKGRAEKVQEKIRDEFGEEFFSTLPVPELTSIDFSRVHSSGFLEKCDRNPADAIRETFELVNADGSYNRYNPEKAKKQLSDLVSTYRKSCNETYRCLQEAEKKNFSYYLGGGFHHSLSDKGRGFCLFNDIMIAAKKFQEEVRPGCIWVIDIDAHKGCGTAAISQHDSTVLTFSIHMKNGWPLDSGTKTDPWFIPSDIDIEIGEGEEATYLSRLKTGLLDFEKVSGELPILAIIVDGSDPFEKDALPSASLLKLTREQCLERNVIVYDFLKSRGIPQSYLMAGGYGEENWIIHHQFIRKVIQLEGQ